METPWDRTVMGVDQSMTSTGIVVGGQGMVDFMDVFSTSSDKTDDLSDFKRCMKIRDAIIKVAETYMVEKVYIEGLSFNAPGNSNRQLAGLLYTIVTTLIEKGFEVQVVAPTTLKKSATGKGNANKDQMFEYLPDMIKEQVNEFPKKARDDVADAYWLCMYDSRVIS